MIETVKEYIESTGGEWSNKLEIAYQELDKALDNYNKTFKVDFKPLVEELCKVIIQYNNRNKK